MAIQINSAIVKTAKNGNQFKAVEFATGLKATMWAGKPGYDLLQQGATVEITTSDNEKDGKVYHTITSATPAMVQATPIQPAQAQTQSVVVPAPEPKPEPKPRYYENHDKSIEGQVAMKELGEWFRSDKKMPLIWQTAYLMAIKQKLDAWGVGVEGKAIEVAIEGLNKPAVAPEPEAHVCAKHKVAMKQDKTGVYVHVVEEQGKEPVVCKGK